MSVRRLAEDSVQPASFAFTDENAAWAEATIRKYPEGREQSAVIPLLMRAQDQEGWVTKAAIEHVADRLHMPLIRVLEVATFYTQFQLKPVGTRAHIQVCGTTPCMLRGSDELKAVCRKKIHPQPFHRNEAGTLSWEEVECLGACVNAPMVMVFQDTYEDLTPERLEEIIDLFDAGRGSEVAPGPQNGRHLSAPIGGLTSLTGEYADKGAESGSEDRPSTRGAADQGSGAGAAISTPPSQAGRPDTDAPETNPAIKAPGRAAGGEAEISDDLVAEAHQPGAGQTGGSEQGPTGAVEDDFAERGTVMTYQADGGERSDGPLAEKGAAAEDAVVQDFKRVDGAQGSGVAASGSDTDLSGRDQSVGHVLEGERRDTSDTEPGPVAADHFASKAEEGASGAGSRESVSRRPANLLGEPEGSTDDLKRIRGIGPVLEVKLNQLGVFHIRQVAAWSLEELLWVDDQLSCRGRAVRDRWVEQARNIEDRPAGSAGE